MESLTDPIGLWRPGFRLGVINVNRPGYSGELLSVVATLPPPRTLLCMPGNLSRPAVPEITPFSNNAIFQTHPFMLWLTRAIGPISHWPFVRSVP